MSTRTPVLAERGHSACGVSAGRGGQALRRFASLALALIVLACTLALEACGTRGEDRGPPDLLYRFERPRSSKSEDHERYQALCATTERVVAERLSRGAVPGGIQLLRRDGLLAVWLSNDSTVSPVDADLLIRAPASLGFHVVVLPATEYTETLETKTARLEAWHGDLESYAKFVNAERDRFLDAESSGRPYKPTEAGMRIAKVGGAPTKELHYFRLIRPELAGVWAPGAPLFERVDVLPDPSTSRHFLRVMCPPRQEEKFWGWVQAHSGLSLALVLGGQILSTFSVPSEEDTWFPINMGRGLSHGARKERANAIAAVLRSGVLPLRLTPVAIEERKWQ